MVEFIDIVGDVRVKLSNFFPVGKIEHLCGASLSWYCWSLEWKVCREDCNSIFYKQLIEKEVPDTRSKYPIYGEEQ